MTANFLKKQFGKIFIELNRDGFLNNFSSVSYEIITFIFFLYFFGGLNLD